MAKTELKRTNYSENLIWTQNLNLGKILSRVNIISKNGKNFKEKLNCKRDELNETIKLINKFS